MWDENEPLSIISLLLPSAPAPNRCSQQPASLQYCKQMPGHLDDQIPPARSAFAHLPVPTLQRNEGFMRSWGASDGNLSPSKTAAHCGACILARSRATRHALQESLMVSRCYRRTENMHSQTLELREEWEEGGVHSSEFSPHFDKTICSEPKTFSFLSTAQNSFLQL